MVTWPLLVTVLAMANPLCGNTHKIYGITVPKLQQFLRYFSCLLIRNQTGSSRRQRGLIGADDAVAALAFCHVEGLVGDAHDTRKIGFAARDREADADGHALADLAAA